MSLIKTSNLSKTYTIGKNIEAVALGGVNLTIERGDFVAIAGPSGSGKSSLLNLLGALDTPTSGSIFYENTKTTTSGSTFYENTDITKIPISQLALFRLKEIGFVFQAYNLINTLTAIENVEYIMLLQGIPRHKRRKRSIEILKRVGLESYIHRYPAEMSGGQQQRVAVSRAIVAQPNVVMADEPTANLDSKTAESLLDLMKELNEEKGITFVFSTHDQMIMSKARKLILLKDGKIDS
jgi:putative ABC transport system ATP-binding protein